MPADHVQLAVAVHPLAVDPRQDPVVAGGLRQQPLLRVDGRADAVLDGVGAEGPVVRAQVVQAEVAARVLQQLRGRQEQGEAGDRADRALVGREQEDGDDHDGDEPADEQRSGRERRARWR